MTSVQKELTRVKLGIWLRQQEGKGLVVHSLALDGLLAISDLRPGDLLTGINECLV